MTEDRQPALPQRLGAELIGTAFLLIAVVGSGIAAQRLSSTDLGLELLENSIATGLGLALIILTFGPISGAHLNPVVTLTAVLRGRMPWSLAFPYVSIQVAGALVGTVVANLMFGLPATTISTHLRDGPAIWLAELVATFGLIVVVYLIGDRQQLGVTAAAVGAYIAAAYWFTSSTSFANPAVTVARMFSDTFAGIAPTSAPAFVLAQLLGTAVAVALLRFLATERSSAQPGT
ncbi:MAG TPA: MIP/aquaporin family protein [Chloroflexota bacterium]